MTRAPQPKPATAPRSRSRLYRTVLGIAVAALFAAWLPFSILYIGALTKHAAAVASVSASHTISLTAGHHASSPAPITTRASAAPPPGIG